MTVSYSADFASSTFSVFFRVLWKWRGSVYSLVWKSLTIFVLLYVLLYVVFKNLLTQKQQETFMEMSRKAEKLLGVVPLMFLLGFYTETVLTRWWKFYTRIPYPDKLSMLLSTYLHGKDERPRLMRRTIMRYVNLAYVNVFIKISIVAKKRFPTMDHLVVSGILTENEKDILNTFVPGDVWWVPVIWAMTLVNKARTEGYIRDQYSVIVLHEQLLEIRGSLGSLLGQDWISFPLVYTQVVMVAVYSFCTLCLFGRQTFVVFPTAGNLTPGGTTQQSRGKEMADYSAPIKTILQYIFYLGWLKAAEVCLNPVGEDDDDLPVNWIIDRNIYISYILTDEMHQECPELVKDAFWESSVPLMLPYTQATKKSQASAPFEGSAAKVIVTNKDSKFLVPEPQKVISETITRRMSNIIKPA